MDDLPDWMVQQGENDEVWILPTMNRTHFDNVIDIQPGGIALKHQPDRPGVRVALVSGARSGPGSRAVSLLRIPRHLEHSSGFLSAGVRRRRRDHSIRRRSRIVPGAGIEARLRPDGPRDRGAELERVVGGREGDAGQRRFTRGAYRVEAPEGLGAGKIAEPRRALRSRRRRRREGECRRGLAPARCCGNSCTRRPCCPPARSAAHRRRGAPWHTRAPTG